MPKKEEQEEKGGADKNQKKISGIQARARYPCCAHLETSVTQLKHLWVPKPRHLDSDRVFTPKESARICVCVRVCVYLCDRLRPSGNEEVQPNVYAARHRCEKNYDELREQSTFSIA